MSHSRTRLASALVLLALTACRVAPATTSPPESLKIILWQGGDAESAGDSAGATLAYERAVKEFPDHAVAWSQLGEWRRFGERDHDAATLAFRKAIDAPIAAPWAVARAWRGLGEIARSAGRIDEAIQLFEKSLSIGPLTEANRSLSALYATEKRDFEMARHYALEALKNDPEDPIALMQYAVQMIRFKKPQEAERAFAKAIRLVGCDERGRSNDPVHCCVLYNGACYHAVRGDKAAALAMLKEFFITPNHRHITKDEMLRDPDFESLVNDPDFQAMLEYRLPVE